MAKSCEEAPAKGEKRGARRSPDCGTSDARNKQPKILFSADKESEVPTMRKLLKENGLLGQKISLEALHCKPKTLEPTAPADGIYLVGLKGNQKEMLEQVKQKTENGSFLYETAGWEKGHGRIEYRKYEIYDCGWILTKPKGGISAKSERWSRSTENK